ncbi:MAG: hypothetical protein ABS81_02030 [Pseudonocardia sp. SCN 72-86]|nr:MAG: hypothetical protein ABS81_02030 [Pseudonocardia sp. SCN 72-86]
MTLAEVLRGARHILLDFDGPVCALYGGGSDNEVATTLRNLLSGGPLDIPAPIAHTSDPLEVLRYAALRSYQELSLIEAEFVSQEVHASTTATPTERAREAITALASSGRTITIVSNNSSDAVTAYLSRVGLAHIVDGVVGRVPRQPELMKPRPDLLQAAIEQRTANAKECVMIGDSASDIAAARAAGTLAIAFANRPAKTKQLEQERPDVMIESMAEIESVSLLPIA